MSYAHETQNVCNLRQKLPHILVGGIQHIDEQIDAIVDGVVFFSLQSAMVPLPPINHKHDALLQPWHWP